MTDKEQLRAALAKAKEAQRVRNGLYKAVRPPIPAINRDLLKALQKYHPRLIAELIERMDPPVSRPGFYWMLNHKRYGQNKPGRDKVNALNELLEKIAAETINSLKEDVQNSITKE